MSYLILLSAPFQTLFQSLFLNGTGCPWIRLLRTWLYVFKCYISPWRQMRVLTLQPTELPSRFIYSSVSYWGSSSPVSSNRVFCRLSLWVQWGLRFRNSWFINESLTKLYNRVAHSSVFSVIFASFFVPFFMKFGGRFVDLAGKNGTKNTIKNDEKWLLWVLPPPKTPKMTEKRVSKTKTTFRRERHSSSSASECCNFVMQL